MKWDRKGRLEDGERGEKGAHPFMTEMEDYFRLQFRHMPGQAAER